MLPKSRATEEYEQLDILGCGGMAVVYAARHKKTKKLVAIKYLSNQFSSNTQVLDSFEQEAATLKALNHPNIVQYIDAGIYNGRHFLIMEHLQGESFELLPRKRVREGEPPSDEKELPIEHLLDIFISCLDGLAFSHSIDIIHRDIKPENIIITGDYREGKAVPKLIDFGIADSDDDDDLDSTIVVQNALTLPYASPEQVKAQPTGKTSDIFSFGVMMYEKLTGHFPFNGKNQVEIFLQHMRWDIHSIRKYNKAVPSALQDIIFKAINKEEGDRYQSCESFSQALESFKRSYVLSKQALEISPYINQKRNKLLQQHESSNRRKSLFEEYKYLKQILSQFNLMNRRLKMLTAKKECSKEKLKELKKMCKQLRDEHDKVKKRMQMCMGFFSEPLIIDRPEKKYRLPIRFWEQKGHSLTISSIEYFLTFSDGTPIKWGSIDFTEKSRKIIPFHAKEQLVDFFNWDDSYWWFGAYEEKVFATEIFVGKTTSKPPKGFEGIIWNMDFLNAFRRFNKSGVKINYHILAQDQREKQVYARHSEDIIFGAGLYE